MSFPLDDDQFSPDTRATKRRKTGERFAIEASSREFAEGIWDEEDEKEARDEMYGPRPASQRSADSGRTSQTSFKGSRSEFERAHALANPHRRKSRVGNGRVNNGNAPSEPITLDDDEPFAGLTSRQVQLRGFEQGIGAAKETPRRRPSETTSSYFGHKISNSTQSEGASRARAPKSTNLRDTFHRVPPAKDSWPLTWARLHNYVPKDSDTELFLRSTNEYDYIVTGPVPSDVRCQFTFRKVNAAFSDNVSHVRLLGSTDAYGCKYTVDLTFANQEDLHGFLQAVARSITKNQVKVKSEEHMRVIFKKPLNSATSPRVVVPARTIQDEVRPVSNGSERKSIIGNLVGRSRPTISPQSASPPNVRIQSDAARGTARPVRLTRQAPTFQYEPDDYEDEPEVEKFSVIHGLGPPWKKQLTYGSGRRRAVVDFADLPRLDNGEFLNDQLIDFYLLYLFDQAKVPEKKVYIFNTHFFSTLTRRVPGQKGKINYKGVARWTQKEDIFGYDYIVIPINQDIHWYLAIICNVPNIVRGPEVEDLTKSDSQTSEGVKEADSDLPSGPDVKARESVEEIPPPALLDTATPTSELHSKRQIPGTEDSELNTVDGQAIEPEAQPSAEVRNSRVVESPAEETAKLKKLSLSDSRSEGVVANSSFTPLNKTKRKAGPPVRKYDPNQPVVIVLDSLLVGARSATVAALKAYLREEGQEKRQIEARVNQNAYYAKGTQIPAQDNYSDCGVYLLGYAQKFFEDPDGFKNRLLSGEMQVNEDWPNMLPSKMRENMRDILQKLYKEQDDARKQEGKAKKAAKADATVKAADNVVAAKPAVSETGRPKTEATTKEPATTAKEESPGKLLEPPTKPRLASPFSPKSPTKHRRSRSHSATAPFKISNSPIRPLTRADPSPTTNVHHSPRSTRATSPVVLVPSPARKSPKRPLPLSTIQVSSPKRRRISPSKPNSASSPPHPTIRVRSPDPLPKPSPSRRPPTNLVSPTRGSSRDPIPIDDSQESLIRSTAHRERYVSAEPDIIVTSPAPGARLGPTRVGREYLSSPVRRAVGAGPPHTAGDVEMGRRRRRERGGETPEEGEEKAGEVPETPPGDGDAAWNGMYGRGEGGRGAG